MSLRGTRQVACCTSRAGLYELDVMLSKPSSELWGFATVRRVVMEGLQVFDDGSKQYKNLVED